MRYDHVFWKHFYQTPLKETDPIGASNPYGQTKVILEQILKDLHVADPTWKISLLRYFNPVGAHPSGRIGESPETPMNLLPYIQQVAVGRRPCLNVFGNDWSTPDGTGMLNRSCCCYHQFILINFFSICSICTDTMSLSWMIVWSWTNLLRMCSGSSWSSYLPLILWSTNRRSGLHPRWRSRCGTCRCSQ